MSGGGSPKQPKFSPTAAPPTAQDPAVEAAKADIRRRRQRTFSRRDTRVFTPNQQQLKESLG